MWKTGNIRERGHESRSSRCAHKRNLQLWNENEDRESKSEQKRGHYQLPHIPIKKDKIYLKRSYS